MGNTTAPGDPPGPILEPPRPGRRSPLTRHQRAVLRHLAEGNYVIDDNWGCHLMPIGIEVARVTMRALTRAKLIHDAVPLLCDRAGELTAHGRAWAAREFGAEE